MPTGADNLVVRAARAVLPTGAGLAIALTKVTPAGAGLGGGSADAAAILRVLRSRHDLDPDDVVAYKVLGKLYAKEGRQSDADKIMVEAIHANARLSGRSVTARPLPGTTIVPPTPIADEPVFALRKLAMKTSKRLQSEMESLEMVQLANAQHAKDAIMTKRAAIEPLDFFVGQADLRIH